MTATGGHGASETKKATINGLAVVGFGALILGGILLAVYAARYVPDTLSRLSSAVYLSAEKPENATTTAPRGNGFTLFPSADNTAEDESVSDDSSTDEEDASADDKPQVADETEDSTPRTGGPLYVAPRPVYTTQQPQLYGLPDLELFDVRGGYFRGSTFVEDDEVPKNRDAGIKFMVVNTGTNVVSSWRVLVETTGERDAVAQGGMLRPDGYQTFTLRISDSDEDTLRVSIEVDPDDRVNESDERNNDDTLRLELDQ